jgi:hypothetical protein
MGVFGWRMRNARMSNLGDIDLLVGLPHDSVLQVGFETPARRSSG